MNPIYKQNGKAIQVIVGVVYLYELSKTTSVFQYRLKLNKNKNWTISNCE